MSRKCIIVLGMHRSGTSVCTGILSHFKAELGPNLLAPNKENPKGFFENTSVLGINKAILHSLDSDWDNYHSALKKLTLEDAKAWHEKIRTVLHDQFSVNSSIIIKDPRLCLLLPLWLDVLKEESIDVKVIITYRHPLEVASSLAVRNKFSTQKSLLLWMHYFFELEHHSRGLPRLFLHFADDFEDMPKLVSDLENFSGLSISKKKQLQAIHFFEPQLKHQNQSPSFDTTDYPIPHATLLKLIGSKPLHDDDNFRETIDECRAQYHYQLNWFSPPEASCDTKQLKSLTIEHSRLEKRHEAQHQQLQKIVAQLKSVRHELTTSQKELLQTQKKLIQAQQQLASSQQDLLSNQQKLIVSQETHRVNQKTSTLIKEKNKELEAINASLNNRIEAFQLRSEEQQKNICFMNNAQQNLYEINRYYRQQLELIEHISPIKQPNKILLAWLLGENALTGLRDLLSLQTKLNKIPQDDIEQANMREYLEKNSDIRRFVESPPLQSPLWHYIMHGHEEIKQHRRKPLSKSPLKHNKQQ